MTNTILLLILSLLIFFLSHNKMQILLPELENGKLTFLDYLIIIIVNIVLMILQIQVFLSLAISILIWICVLDYTYLRISNKLVLFFILISLLQPNFEWIHLLYAVIVPIILFFINLVYVKVKNQHAFGFGDIKLIYAISLFWGLESWIWVYLSFFVHVLLFLLQKLFDKKITIQNRLAFAPALTIVFTAFVLTHSYNPQFSLTNELLEILF